MTATTKTDIREWLQRAPENTTHMAVVCDTYDWDDYPVYVSFDEDPYEKLGKYKRGENMAKLMEVYNLKMDIEEQLNQHRVFNW